MSDPFSIASGVVGIVSLGLEVVKGLYEYCSTLKEQSSDIARIHDNLSRLHNLLDNLKRQLGARRFRSDDIITLACIKGRIIQCESCIDELKKVADKFNHSQDGLRGALKATVRQATYPFQQSMLHKLEENVDSIFQQVSFSLQLLQSEDIGSIRNHVEDTKDLLESHRANGVAQDIINWLNAPDATVNFNMAHEKLQAGTGSWLINCQLFNDWIKQENSFLWLYGFAGCGKSILCSTAIQHILQHQKSNQDIGVAFFFFAFDDTGKQDASAILRALILQLSGQQSNITPSLHLSRLYDSCRNSTPRNQALLDCLHQLCRSFTHTYIIIDALDESPRDKHRQDVLDVLTTIRGWMEPAIHLLATSRDEVDIRDTLGPLPNESLAVRNDSSNKDIALYITQSLRNKPQLRKWREFHGRIEIALTTQADGVFRWVDCQLREIAICPQTEEHLDKLLTSLPPTLDDTYERMLLGISPAFQDYARQMLMLLCCAKRHLTVPELIYGMAVDLDSTGSNSDDSDPKDADTDLVGSNDLISNNQRPIAVFKDKRKLHNADAVLEVCPGFIEIYRGHLVLEEALFVRISHFSVQEYLKSNRIKKREKVAQYHLQEQAMNTQATRICLAILDKFDESAALQANDHSFPNQWAFDTHVEDMFPWAWYAAESWPDHFRESKDIPPEAASAMIRFRPHALRLSVYHGGRGFSDGPLDFAIYCGLSSVVSVLLHEPTTDIDKITGGCTPLISAAMARNMEVARCLLDRGADVNGHDGGALDKAAETGQVDMAKLLLDQGAEINAKNGSALRAAVEQGHFEMAKFLLEGGADANLVGVDLGQTILWSALTRERLELVRLLLEYGADVNHRDANGETALHAALAVGDEDSVRLLLEHGADVNIGTKEGRTALFETVEFDNEKIARLLVETGADPNVVDKFGNTAQSLAVARDSYDIVDFLSNL